VGEGAHVAGALHIVLAPQRIHADAFAADVAKKIIPAITQLIAAMAGINLNLVSATEIVDKADSECTSMVNELANTFGSII